MSKDIEYEIDISKKEGEYIVGRNKKFNSKFMEEVREETGGKHIAAGVKFGSEYVRSLTRYPNSEDHTHQRFGEVLPSMTCLFKVFGELNRLYTESSDKSWWRRRSILFD